MPFTITIGRRTAAAAATAAVLVAAGTVSTASLDRTATASASEGTCGEVLFDDFSYDSWDDPAVAANGWTVRSGPGGPGVPATWTPENVTFPTVDGGSVLQLQSATDGTARGTAQTEMFQERKFLEGTYAARVKFADAPGRGPDGDSVVETFFSITPEVEEPFEPDYSEIDFEYLPNGGWEFEGNTLIETTWETYQLDPWVAVTDQDTQNDSFEGWHDMVFQVDSGHVRYYLDGELMADHSGDSYPESLMSINFNLWFIDLDGHKGSATSVWTQQVDYVLHVADEALSPEEVDARVDAFRADGVDHTDTVDPGDGDCSC